jgi:hypothetical protein
MHLTDEAIVREVIVALRACGEGQASLAMAGEALMRRLLGLEHEAPAIDGPLNPVAQNTGD